MDSPEALGEYLQFEESGVKIYRERLERIIDGSFITTDLSIVAAY